MKETQTNDESIMNSKQPTTTGQVDAVVGTAKDGQLSDEQIKNWRKVLCTMIGPYALIMPASQVQKFRDKMQSQLDADR